MISLKRYLDQSGNKAPQLSTAAYRATLEAASAAAVRCCPPTGETLKTELAQALEPLKPNHSSGALNTAQQRVLKALHCWGEQTEAYFARRTAEMKEVLLELAGTAESIGKRDQRYSRQINDITVHLQSIAQIDDLSRIKTSLLRSAGELKGCVDRMARETGDSIAALEASVASRRVELEQAQELATLDPLTGLYSRREVEVRIDKKVNSQTAFCVVLIDLNDFRGVNSRHGHATGDELLRQIAKELRMACRTQVILGRWGGDEFVMVLDGSIANTKVKVQRMRPWVFGSYELDVAGAQVKVAIDASIGISEWSPGETTLQMLGRADAEMDRSRLVRG